MANDLSAYRILRKHEVLDVTGISAATVYRWIKDGLFPRPVKLGPNSVGWREADVLSWLESREPIDDLQRHHDQHTAANGSETERRGT